MAVRTGRNIAKSTIRADRRQDRTCDIAAILTRWPERLVLLRNLRIRRVTTLLQYPLDFVAMIAHELEVRLAITITMRAVKRIVTVKLQWQVRKEVTPYCSRTTQVLGRVARPRDRDS